MDFVFFFVFCILAVPCSAVVTQQSWLVTTDLWGNPAYQSLQLDRDGDVLSGVLGGDRLTGMASGSAIEFTATDANKATYIYRGKIDGETLSGIADYPDSNNPTARVRHRFVARRIPERPGNSPRYHEFKPADYSNEFLPHRKPVLTIWPGDSVHTTTVDSGGVDEKRRDARAVRQSVNRAVFRRNGRAG